MTPDSFVSTMEALRDFYAEGDECPTCGEVGHMNRCPDGFDPDAERDDAKAGV